jgi:hypothetical protein
LHFALAAARFLFFDLRLVERPNLITNAPVFLIGVGHRSGLGVFAIRFQYELSALGIGPLTLQALRLLCPRFSRSASLGISRALKRGHRTTPLSIHSLAVKRVSRIVVCSGVVS